MANIGVMANEDMGVIVVKKIGTMMVKSHCPPITVVHSISGFFVSKDGDKFFYSTLLLEWLDSRIQFCLFDHTKRFLTSSFCSY
jgi:hypothetical protein